MFGPRNTGKPGMQAEERSAYLAAEARRHDPDRYLTALFAPAPRRDVVLALILLDCELARVPGMVRERMAGLIRYQWWRDALDEIESGAPARRHPVALALGEALRAGWIDLDPLQALIDARERELEGPPGPAEDKAAATHGRVQGQIYRSLGGIEGREAQAAEMIGTAFGLVSPQGPPLPSHQLARARALVAQGRAAAGRPPRELMAAFLPATLVDSYARHLQRRPGGKIVRPATAPLNLLVRVLLRRP
jgi:phytoene synthase